MVVEHDVAPGCCRGFLDCAEREVLFIKDNVTRGDHPVRRDVVAAIATVVRGVADEYTECGAGVELVVRGSCEVREAATPEHAKLVIGRFDAEEEGERCSGAGGATWPPVNDVCRRG